MVTSSTSRKLRCGVCCGKSFDGRADLIGMVWEQPCHVVHDGGHQRIMVQTYTQRVSAATLRSLQENGSLLRSRLRYNLTASTRHRGDGSHVFDDEIHVRCRSGHRIDVTGEQFLEQLDRQSGSTIFLPEVRYPAYQSVHV